MKQESNPSKAERNKAIWHANRALGIGVATLASQYGVSCQRVRQVIARQDQLQEDAQAEDHPAYYGSVREGVGDDA